MPTKLNILERLRGHISYLKDFKPEHSDKLAQIRKLIDENTKKCHKMQKALRLTDSILRRIKEPYIAEDFLSMRNDIQSYLKMTDFRIARKIKPFGTK